jgi:biotin-(acetyl-CoA carboxylase) ligase
MEKISKKSSRELLIEKLLEEMRNYVDALKRDEPFRILKGIYEKIHDLENDIEREIQNIKSI